MNPRVRSLVDREGISLSSLIVSRKLGWIFREQPVDVGIDALVEIVSTGNATGELLALQVKSGDSYFRERTDEGFVFRGDARHLEYWLRYPVPVILILCSPAEDRCWWQPIDYEGVSSTGKGWKTVVPLTNELSEKSAEPIREFVKAWRAGRRERGVPAEDELAVVFHWLGRCKLVHKLDHVSYPPGASSQLQVPDLLAAFEVGGTAIPVLIEVVEWLSDGVPSWEPAYVDSLQRYADLLKLPLLIALKYLDFWTLFEVRHLRKVGDKLIISFSEAMRETLLGTLAGDFSFSFRPGVGIHLKIRKERETDDGGFDGQVEEAYLLNAEGEKHTGEGGILQLFTCIEQESRVQEDETHVTQSFVIPTSGQAEFAHRALVTLLGAFSDKVPLDWHRVLVRRQLPLLFMSPQQAVQNGLNAGFIQHKITIRPRTGPMFLGA
ncbi:MAG TPA: DUF4365 domain-containing protein [Thermoanaerobaculia bacterium]|jgi:hypothetical protein|nr:DUF4365 domain-containing protein [Thermoanaerobaculia bacterium]